MPIQTGLLRLDDDALLSIVSFLYGQEALGVALTSKRLHALAISRVAAHAKCLSSSALIRLHDYLRIRGPQPRVQHLEILYIYVGHELDAEQAVDPLRILAELLAAAKNLRLLTVAELPEVLDLHSSIGDALVTLPNLVNLRLCDGVDGRTLELLSLMRGSLKRLLLSYEWKAQSATTDAALFNVLVKHTRLQRLCLYNFLPSGPLNHASIFSNARFSSLRRLYMVAVNVEALDLVCFCPYLTHLVLVLGLAEEEYAPRTAFEPDDSRRWPSLQELYLQVVTIGVTSCIQRRISQVDKIRIPSRLAPCHSDELRGPLPAVLRTASPVQLSLTVVAETETINALAPTLAALPRLRALELRVMLSRWHIEDDAEAWLVDTLALLSGLRLTSLYIVIPAVSPPFDDPGSLHMRSEEEFQKGVRVQIQCERQRMEIARTLPGRLVRAVPTLCLLRVVFQRSLGGEVPWTETDPDRVEDVEEWKYEWSPAPWDGPTAHEEYHQRWWRVDGNLELRELTWSQARHAMRES